MEYNGNADLLLYTVISLIGVGVFALIKLNRSLTFKGTKWASKNKLKSQILIVIGQILLAVLGMAIGFELLKLNYSISEWTQYLFAGLMLVTFLLLWLSDKRSGSHFLRSFYLKKVGHLIMGLSLFALMISVGNNITDTQVRVNNIETQVSYGDDEDLISQDIMIQFPVILRFNFP